LKPRGCTGRWRARRTQHRTGTTAPGTRGRKQELENRLKHAVLSRRTAAFATCAACARADPKHRRE
jgi:hypothetical protein